MFTPNIHDACAVAEHEINQLLSQLDAAALRRLRKQVNREILDRICNDQKQEAPQAGR